MYKCAFCKTDVPNRMTRVVTSTRAKQYAGGFLGWEIVEERPTCASCATEFAIPLPSKFEKPLARVQK